MFRRARVALMLSSALLICHLLCFAQTNTNGDNLVGIWANETRFDSGPSGELIVVRRGTEWRASIAKLEAKTDSRADDIRFDFSGKGKFRGNLNQRGDAIDGFWIGPVGNDASGLSDPAGTGQPFATPVVLRRASANSWKGTVRPLERSFTLYLKIFRNADGSLAGAFRNPEANSTGGATLYRVSREGDSVIFSAGADPAKPTIKLNASLLNSPERLRIMWSDIGGSIDLSRQTAAAATAFFPRPPGEKKYVYDKPSDTGDGWSTARAAETGLDEASLARLVQRLAEADPAIGRPGLMHSILVAHRGKLVLEEYFFGFDREKQHDIRSAGKTFASVMLGAAMREKAGIGPESKIYELVPAMAPFANPDPRKSKITLAHLMTHTSGLACDDNDENSPGGEGRMQSQSQQPNWWKYTLDLPVVRDPGSRYAYCSAGMNLVGAGLTTATRTWLPELFDRTVARPLQFGRYYWNLMPNDEGYQGGGAYIRPRDLLKLGQLYLDGGVWNGRRIVDSSWVKISTESQAKISPATTGLSPEDFGNFYGEGEDGFAWHLGQMQSGGRTYRTYAATGNGGQVLIVVPDAELVVLFTGGNYGQGGIWSRWAGEIIPKELISAIRK